MWGEMLTLQPLPDIYPYYKQVIIGCDVTMSDVEEDTPFSVGNDELFVSVAFLSLGTTGVKPWKLS